MHEFGIGRAANVAIASLPGFTLPGDVSGSDKYYREDVVDPPVLAHRGAVPVPTGPGLGHRAGRGAHPAEHPARGLPHRLMDRNP